MHTKSAHVFVAIALLSTSLAAAIITMVAIQWAAAASVETTRLMRPSLAGDDRVPATSRFEQHPARVDAEICANLIINSPLDVVDTGGGSFTADAWQFLESILYYVREGEGELGELAYDGDSFLLKDGDSGDPTPKIDKFAQTNLQLPQNLSSVIVSYQRRTENGNEEDLVWGELWLVDEQGGLIKDVAYWDVYDKPGAWAPEAVAAPPEVLLQLNGKRIALVIFNDTDGSLPEAEEAEKEWMLFDEIVLSACYKEIPQGADIFLPTILSP